VNQRKTIQSAVAAAVLCLVVLTGCSKDDSSDASTCKDLQNLSTEVRGLKDVNLAQSGVSGLQEQTDAIDTAWDAAKKSGDEQFGSELDGFDQSVKDLGSTLSNAKDSGDSLSDVVSKVKTDVQQISTSWKTLTTAVSSEMSDCDLSAGS